MFGINRRDITVFQWKAVTKHYKTSSIVKTYAANDAGDYVGRYTENLRDNIIYENNFISKYKLPNAPNLKGIGAFNFGNIDKLVKIPTSIKAPQVTYKFKKTKYFKVTVKNKKTRKVVKYEKIKIRISNAKFSKTFVLKTNNKGVVKINTNFLNIGKYYVVISTANYKYTVSQKSKIIIR